MSASQVAPRAMLQEAPETAPRTATTMHEALRRVAAKVASEHTGARFLLRGGDEQFVSWSRLIQGARKVAAALLSQGVESGDRVALFFRTEPDFVEALLGVQLVGAVPVPLYPPVRLGRRHDYEQRTAKLLSAAGVRMAIASKRMKRLLRSTLALEPLALGVSTPDELAALVPESAARSAGFLEGRSAANDLGLIQFSSGTTGSPKPVALSQQALLWQAELLGGLWPEREGVRHSVVSWLPLYHDMGLIGCVLPALLRPADLTLLSPEQFVARPASWLQAISRYQATLSAAPNFAYALCVDRVRDEELEGVDLGSWQAALNGAEAVAPKTLRAFAERFAAFGFRAEALTPVYGLAEATLAVTFSPLDTMFVTERFDRKRLAEGQAEICRATTESLATESIEIASVGSPVRGFAIEVRDEQRQPLPEGRVGRVWASGPSLMEGYLGQSARTEETLVDGWLDTGDLGFVHDGTLFLCGRAKDVLVLQGRNWAPEPVEEAMGRVAGVEPGGVIAVTTLPAEGDREELWVLAESSRERWPVKRRPDRSVNRGSEPGGRHSSVIDAGRRRILTDTGLLAARIHLLVNGSLPRTSSGKLQRRRGLEMFLAGELAASPGTPACSVEGPAER